MRKFQYTIAEKELKGMGYIFQKLYAADYKTYRLEIEKWSYTIWLFVMGKSIEVNDWYSNTYNVLEFYKANRDDKNFSDKEYIRIYLNRKTGDVTINTRWEEIEEAMSNKDIDAMKALITKYKDMNDFSEYYLYKEKMDRLIIEVAKLNPIVS